MKCYHMTTLDRLKSINQFGLLPRSEENSKLVNDDKVKVFFSEGFTGSIALYVDFNIIYNKIKNREIEIDDQKINDKVIESNSLKEYLGNGVYLCFDMNNTKNERNFENGCTSDIIEPQRLYVVGLKKIDTGLTIFSRFDVINFMMSKTDISDIKYYGEKYPNSPTFEEATIRIQNKVSSYYNENKETINKYKKDKYELIEIPLNTFMKEYL